MVLAVCRRHLPCEQDAEDAFQGTFVVLARKAAAIRRPESVAGWLHGVAHRIAVKLRTAAAVRRRHEAQARPRPTDDPLQAITVRERYSDTAGAWSFTRRPGTETGTSATWSTTWPRPP
jgi:DNA-directed RNA polymerase specialized sigma24 family protein